MIKLIEVVQTNMNDYSLREVYVNPSHVVYLREDFTMQNRLHEGKSNFPSELDTRQTFTRVQIHNGTTGTEFVVIGPPKVVEEKLNNSAKKRELLHG